MYWHHASFFTYIYNIPYYCSRCRCRKPDNIMKRLFKLLGSVLLLTGLVTLGSCGGDDDGPSYIQLSETSVHFSAEGGTKYVYVSGGTAREINGYSSWVNASIEGTSIRVSCQPNSGGQRSVSFSVSGGDTSVTLDVTQSAGDNPGGGDTLGGGDTPGGDNPGGGDTPGGGDNPGGGTSSAPKAPTGLRVENYGNTNIPDVRISWNESAGATQYTVYRAFSASGSFTPIGFNSLCFYTDNSVKFGNTYYYKVKASNASGASDFSETVSFTFDDQRAPGPVEYTNCTATSSQITLRWRLPSNADYGKPTSAVLRIWNPYSEEWVDQEISPTATSASFAFAKYIDDYGYVKSGVILKNQYGSGGGSAKIYDTKNKKWLN